MNTAFPPVPYVLGVGAPLLKDNVDTDAIIPSREIKGVTKTGLADGLFAGWRYRAPGTRDPDPTFVLNDPRYRDAKILLAGRNFGCGSSREHAVWALHEYGIRAIIAETFAPIFRANCVTNGIIPVLLDQGTIAAIVREGKEVTIDLLAGTARCGTLAATFDIDPEARAMLAEGLDAIGLTLRHQEAIASVLASDRVERPWIYLERMG